MIQLILVGAWPSDTSDTSDMWPFVFVERAMEEERCSSVSLLDHVQVLGTAA